MSSGPRTSRPTSWRRSRQHWTDDNQRLDRENTGRMHNHGEEEETVESLGAIVHVFEPQQ